QQGKGCSDTLGVTLWKGNALGYSIFRCYLDLGVLQIGTRAKVIENQGADDEEISEGGIPRVIVLGYDGLPMQPVAPPSPDYIPGPKDPQTPPVPQDEDEREPMFVQAHDPDYVPEPIYPEYIPLEDEHEFPAEEQPLPPVDSPTAESPGYVTESDPEEDPEEYEDDETEDGPVDYPMDGGDDGDDDDGDSSGDDADGEDEDDEDEEEEEEEHLALADSAIVVPVDEPVFPPKGTEPVIPPPSTDITIRARITVRPQTSISLPPEAEVERLLAMTTPSPSPPISLSPPSAGERLVRSMAPPAHSSPPPVPSPLLPSSGCPTQIQTLRIASTQALTNVASIGRDSQVIRDMRREMSDMQAELLALQGQQRRARQPGPDARIPDHHDASRDADSHIQQIMAPTTRRGPNTPVNNTNPNNMTPESIQAMIDQALLRNSTNGDGSHSSHEDNRRNVQTARPCFYADFMKCQPLNFKGTEGVVGAALTWWNGEIKKLKTTVEPKGPRGTCSSNTVTFPRANHDMYQVVANRNREVDKALSRVDFPKLKNKDRGKGMHKAGLCSLECRKREEMHQETLMQFRHLLMEISRIDTIKRYSLKFLDQSFNKDLMPVELGSFDVDYRYGLIKKDVTAVIVCERKLVQVPYGN
ncbi:hypothetical protein Tco_0506669, partial [Tanacetum coccineum]